MSKTPRPSRREFLKTGASLGALCLAHQAFPAIARGKRRTDKPNVVFLGRISSARTRWPPTETAESMPLT